MSSPDTESEMEEAKRGAEQDMRGPGE
jgi:hypothetical protein